MRAMVCEALGGVDNLILRDVAVPHAKPGEVVVALQAAALNFPDILTIAGTYQHRQMPPFVPGMEGAGVVAAVGKGIAPALIGERVIVSARGTFAEQVAVAVDALQPMPAGWSFAEAAAFPVIARTAYHALVHRAGLRRGETLLVNGASGGTGHMAVKLGKALGARVIATGGDAAKLAIVRALGADATVLTGEDDLAGRIKAANGGRGVDVVFDPVGGPVLEASLKACAFAARVAIIGFTSGDPNAVRTNYALIKGLSVLGVRAGEAARADPSIQRDYEIALPLLAAEHDLRPRIAATFPLEQACVALRTLADRRIVGKVSLTM